MPKSSSASLKPHALSSASTFWVRSGSAMAVDSVISTVTSSGSTPAPADRRHDLLRQVRRPELARRQVEPDGHLQAVGGPSGPLAADLAQDPVPDRLDEPELLGERDELARRRQSAGRVGPADQALDRHDPARGELDDGLPVQDPRLLLHGLAEPGGEREPLHRILAARREDRVAARLVALGLVHRVVGVLQQRRRVRGVLREEADPDRPGGVERRPAQVEGLRHRLADADGHGFGHDDRRVGRVPGPDAAPLEVRQQDHELVAALARNEVGVTHALAQPVGELGEQQVARVVPQGVVHELEVVEVEEHDPDAGVVAAGPRDGLVEHLLEQVPVRQARELVVVGQERDLLLGLLARRDVEDHALDQPGVPVLVVDGVRLLQDPLDRPVLVDHAVLVVERRERLVGLLVLVPRAVDVLGVHVAAPRVVILQPDLGRDADEVADLRAHVDRRLVLVDGVEVDDRRDVLHEAAVLGLRLVQRLATELELRRVPERHHEEPGGVLQHAHVDLDRERGTVGGPAHRVDAREVARLQEVGPHEHLDVLADEFVAREPREGLGVAVRVDDPPVVGGDDEALRRGLEQRAGLDRAGDGGGLGHGGARLRRVVQAGVGLVRGHGSVIGRVPPIPSTRSRADLRPTPAPACAPGSPTATRRPSGGRGTGREGTPQGPGPLRRTTSRQPAARGRPPG